MSGIDGVRDTANNRLLMTAQMGNPIASSRARTIWKYPQNRLQCAFPQRAAIPGMGWTDRGRKWVANRAQLRRFDAMQTSSRDLARALRTAIPKPADVVVCLLIDQSGSMLGAPIGATASAVRALAEALAEIGVASEILGFSTAGWHGGFARQDWIRQDSPKRPGRLCALLHVVYKDANTRDWDEESRDTFLNPDILRENLDGEAIEWAVSRLARLPHARKLLIVLSDGAPVDDSTLEQNGPSYLWRHLRDTIKRVNARGTITLGAVGIGHRVDELYPHSREALLGSIADTTVELIGELAAQS
ncbi:hypothetical protein OK349_05095 [Sphingomonas sp. BT-65]|uniref:cobaltochelatase CobT-related protein n=1 Tax=Sphingomonas sp. BT-65 TaxID=2989821 RepID=UPI002235B731|nr:hypothetical protein [Sphingomonas sp. BT-65]MCW4461074.1 hypothetical protein [Sphingomonas sp. BT-65]